MSDAISGYTKDEIITAASFPLGYKSSDISGDLSTHLSLIFDEALLGFCELNDWRFLHTTGTFTVLSGARTVNLQTETIYCDHPEALYITTAASRRRVRSANYQTLRDLDPDGTLTGAPYAYARWGETSLYFERTLDADLDFLLLYKRIIPMVTSGSSYPIVPRRLQRHLINYLRWKFAEDKGDSRHMNFKSTFETEVQRAISNDNLSLEITDSVRQEGELPGLSESSMNDFLARVYD